MPLGDRVRIVEGDITSPLRLEVDDVTEIFHFAAVYDLSLKRDLGIRVSFCRSERIRRPAKCAR